MSARHHTEWLSLLEVSGPFLSMPVLLRVFPQGLELDQNESERRRELSRAYEEWLDNQRGHQPEPAIHRAWIRYVLTQTLEFPEKVIAEGQSLPQDLKADVAEQAETLRPDVAILDQDDSRPRLLIQFFPLEQALDKPLPDHHWKASPEMRMMELLHTTNVPLGLITNGEQWMLVYAPRGETTAFVSWYANLWFEEHITLRAFRSLLGAYRFFGVADEETLATILAQSAEEQQEVTDQLGYQVRQAVEVLIQAMDRIDQQSERNLLANVTETKLYESALTVMMRLVFLFSAEERGLFPLDDPLYENHYAASTLRAQLRKAADQFGEEVIERRTDAWCRLLATFRVIYGGVEHERLRLPPYGGSLFDPDRFPFLEGRNPGTTWKDTPADPLPIDNRTVLHLLEALQMLQVKVPGGGPAEARRLSFRALDIEQIGYVYEGLLDHTAKSAESVVLGLTGTKDKEPEIPLPELEAYYAEGEEVLLEFLKDQTGRSTNALRNALQAEADIQKAQLLRVSCANDDKLYERVLPYAELIRDDAFGQPIVIMPGSVYVTAGEERRKTGTHYTPRSLTEPIVQHTLEPQVYDGPVEGKPQGKWKLRSPAHLLNLKICDMAMGSGAFLVQACRYLSERLVETWEDREENLRRRHGKDSQIMITPEGELTRDLNEAIPADTEERLILAKRLIADRCLYGVDKNPLAVEMAKLSIWLITLDKNRPFSFLDHAFKCGDSIVGVSLDQLRHWNLDAAGDPLLFADTTKLNIKQMIDLRREIEGLPVNDVNDQKHKEYLLTKSNAIAHDLREGCDMLISSYWSDLTKSQQDDLRTALLAVFRDKKDVAVDLQEQAYLGDLRSFHWELEFPEVFLDDARSGFDAFVGNPPFIGGRRIRETLGDSYRGILYNLYPDSSGNADYCSFFFLRAYEHLGQGGTLGLLATNTIAQGDTRQTGLDRIISEGGIIYHAANNRPWPGNAAVVVDVVHISRDVMTSPFVLDEKQVKHISSYLDSRATIGDPYPLVANKGKSFQGSVVVGIGFIMPPEEAQALIARDPRNKDALFPYLNGEDLNSHPEQLPSRWVINFFDWPLERGEESSWFDADKKQQKAWLRGGIMPHDYPGPVAADYPDCLNIVREKVYPVRAKVRRKAHRKYWWHYGDKRPALYHTIKPLNRVLIRPRVSDKHAPVFVLKGWVYSEATVVFAFDDDLNFAIMQSSIHENWVRKYASTLKGDIRYSPSDVFDTFPFPQGLNSEIQSLGIVYHEHRRQLMLNRQEGLTATYNRFHDPDEAAAEIERLRQLHTEMDQAVATAYGWDDLDLGHDFHETPQGIRFTISESVRIEVLDRLLGLNHQRYEEEVKAGLHNKKKGENQRRKEVKASDGLTLF